MSELINYSELVDDAMHSIVKKSLKIFSLADNAGEHHFFISFATSSPGVVLSQKLRSKYPVEMTIVLQYQFEDLTVDNEKFAVTLSFDNVKERIEIPFRSLTAFADPSVKFGLQFKQYDEDENNHPEKDLDEDDIVSIAIDEVEKHLMHNKDTQQDPNNVVMLDAFRKKK